MKKKINVKNNPKVLNEFLNYLQKIRAYSICTIKSYESDLRMFFGFIIEYKNLNVQLKNISIFPLTQINTSDIIAFLVYLNYHRNNSSYTRERKKCAINSFYDWLYSRREKLQKENPTVKLPKIQPHFRIPKHLSLNQAKEIQTIFTEKNSKTPIRNNAIITLFLSTGMRLSELISINIDDIDFETNIIKIIGKRKKQRIVYFSEYCKKVLKDYMKIRNKNKNIKDTDALDALFISTQNKRIGIDGVEDICKKAYKLMGLQDNGYVTHTLRHTAATIMYRYVSQDLLVIRDFLGHDNLTATEIYTHVYNEDIKNAVDRNPLNI